MNILWILLWIIAVGFVLLMVLLCAPIVFNVHIISCKERFCASGEVYYFYPIVLRFFGDASPKAEIILFNHRRWDLLNNGGDEFAASPIHPPSQPARPVHENTFEDSRANFASVSPKTTGAKIPPPRENKQKPTTNRPPKPTWDKGPDTPKENLWQRYKRFKEGRIYYMLRQTKLYKKLWRWIIGVGRAGLRIIMFKTLRFNATIGTDDPALTGKIYGYWTAFYHGIELDRSKHFKISVLPEFTRECIDIDLDIKAKTSLARLMVPFMVAVFTFPYIRSGLVFWKVRKLK